MSTRKWYLEEHDYKIYTGVGSRKTPKDICELMTLAARRLQNNGWHLRSGGAYGADTAFASGTTGDDAHTIFLPGNVCSEAEVTASRIHPAWNTCSTYARRLHARNVYQVLGRDMRTPSKGLICWTPRGESVGGTRTAIVLALKHNVPVINLGRTTEAVINFIDWVCTE
jgi:hypothetical protein